MRVCGERDYEEGWDFGEYRRRVFYRRGFGGVLLFDERFDSRGIGCYYVFDFVVFVVFGGVNVVWWYVDVVLFG